MNASSIIEGLQRLKHLLLLLGHLFHNKGKLFELLTGYSEIPKYHQKPEELFYQEELEPGKLSRAHRHNQLNEQQYLPTIYS